MYDIYEGKRVVDGSEPKYVFLVSWDELDELSMTIEIACEAGGIDPAGEDLYKRVKDLLDYIERVYKKT